MRRFDSLFQSLGLKKGLVFVTIGNFVSIGMGAILWFILASQMTAHNYGSLNYYISVAIIFHSIGIMGFDSTLATFVPKGITRMLTESSSLILIAGVVLSLILLLIFMSVSLIAAFLALLFFTFSISEMLGKHLYREFMISLIIQRMISLVSVPLLFRIYGVDGALYGYTISYLPLCYRYFYSLRKFEFSLSTLRPIRRFFFHSFALGVSKNLVYFSDKLIIMPLFGLGILGYYQFGIQVLTTVSIVPIIVYNYLLPEEAGGKNKQIKKIGLLGILLTATLTFALVVLVPKIISWLFPSFQNAVLPTQIVLLAGIPLCITSIFNSFFMASEKSFYVIVAAVIFLVIQYALISILGLSYGLIGISAATVIASIIQALYLFAMKKKVSYYNKLSHNGVST